MNKILLCIVSLVSAASLASAANNVSYTATANPASNPDGVDQSANPVDVWTVTTTPGFNGTDGSGSYYGSQPSLGNAWQLFSFQNSGVGHGGSAFATTTFAGGALAIGQTVSINFNMRALDAPGGGTNLSINGQAGISLLNGSGSAITFAIIGGGPNNYYYTDAGSTGANAGPMPYQYQSFFNIAITATGPGTYSAVAGSDSWSGTYSGSLIGMQVFDSKGGNGSDVGFNNLMVVPEPGTFGLVAGGLAVFGLGFRRRARRS
ncbi:MAG TPA: PEP-CTERM sorting domain-containing protein [Verrucomicrobiae bacterium]|nr:PEP-CTERM sorting domain-containing protein [Verrucomicrobiae bacterium]